MNIITHTQNRVNQIGYIEKHHIIPKSMGGSNSKSNLVELTPKEHYVCHLLLTKMVTGEFQRKMWYAHYMMMRGKNRYKPNSRMYEIAKQNMIAANKQRPGPNLGKVMSQEQKNKIGASQKGIPKGPMTEEHKQHLRGPKSEEHKKKLSESRLGKSWGYKHSEETKRIMGEKSKGRKQPTRQCEYCKKEISITNYKRWHGGNCKEAVKTIIQP